MLLPIIEPSIAPPSKGASNPPRRPPPIPAITPISAAVVATVAPSATMLVATMDVLAETLTSQYGTTDRVMSSRVELSCKCLWSIPRSIIDLTRLEISSVLWIVKGSVVCFWIFAHPAVPRVMLVPQYSHVIIISPNFGAIGAPQLGHFNDSAFEGARILAPHLEQNPASSGR